MRYGDRIVLTVLLNGVDITASVERFRARFGYDLRVCECDIDCALIPSVGWPANAEYATLQVTAGLVNSARLVVPETGSLPSGNIQRFNGLAINAGADFWPNTPKIVGRGWLTLADRLAVPTDAWGTYLNPFDNPDPLAVPSKFDPPGIDMTLDGFGQTDSDQVIYVLSQCGLTPRINHYPDDIGGLPYLLGTQTKAYEQFVWRRGQSGLSYIEELDAMYGFRTFETAYGFILRQLTSNLVPLFSTVGFTVNENTNILEGASIVRDIEQIRNRVEVRGWDPGDGGNVWASAGSAAPLPPGIALVSEYVQSALIEKYQALDPGDGLSSEETAGYWLGQLQYPMFEAVVPTWRDDAFAPGSIVYLNAPHLLGVNQAMTCKHLEIEVTPNTFTQYLTLRAQDYGVFRGYPALPLTLGAA